MHPLTQGASVTVPVYGAPAFDTGLPGSVEVTAGGAGVTSGPGEDGVWNEGETVEAQVRFTETVTVDGAPDAGPTLKIRARRHATHGRL